jgi:hypothetical protein
LKHGTFSTTHILLKSDWLTWLTDWMIDCISERGDVPFVRTALWNVTELHVVPDYSVLC